MDCLFTYESGLSSRWPSTTRQKVLLQKCKWNYAPVLAGAWETHTLHLSKVPLPQNTFNLKPTERTFQRTRMKKKPVCELAESPCSQPVERATTEIYRP